MKILPLILANILITTSSLLAEDVEKVIIENRTPYQLFIDLDTKPTRTGKMLVNKKALSTSLTDHKFNLETAPISYDIGFSGSKPNPAGIADTQIRVQSEGNWDALKSGVPDGSSSGDGISNTELPDRMFYPEVTLKYDSKTKTLHITIAGSTF